MKLIMIVLTLLGLAMLIASGLAWAQSQAVSASIICNIGELRNGQNAFDEVVSNTVIDLKKIQESFKPAMWLGCVTAAIGMVGLIIVIKGNKQTKAQSVQEA